MLSFKKLEHKLPTIFLEITTAKTPSLRIPRINFFVIPHRYKVIDSCLLDAAAVFDSQRSLLYLHTALDMA